MRMFGTNAMLEMLTIAHAAVGKPLSAEEREEFAKRRAEAHAQKLAEARVKAEAQTFRAYHSCGHTGKPPEYYRKRNVPKKLMVKP